MPIPKKRPTNHLSEYRCCMFRAGAFRQQKHPHLALALSLSLFALTGCVSLMSDAASGPPPFTGEPKVSGVAVARSLGRVLFRSPPTWLWHYLSLCLRSPAVSP